MRDERTKHNPKSNPKQVSSTKKDLPEDLKKALDKIEQEELKKKKR